MLKYLADKYGERASIGDRQNLINMRNEVKRLEGLLKDKKDKQADKSDHSDKDGRGSEDETEESVSFNLNDKLT